MSKLHKKVGLLIVLAFFASLMEADSSLYEIVCITNKTHQSWIRIISFLTVFISSIFFIRLLLSDHFQTFDNVVDVIFSTLFSKAFYTRPDSVFRVSIYKKYEFNRFSWRFQFLKRRFLFFISPKLASFSHGKKLLTKLTKELDCSKAIKELKDRRLENGCDYLLCYKRFGYRYGEKVDYVTTYPIKIDNDKQIFRLFVGKVFESEELYEIAINNHDINGIVALINQPDNSDKVGYLELINNTPSDNYQKLLDTGKLSNLTEVQQDRLKNFMKNTNTLAHDLFAINNGIHSNHFLGFKVKKNGQTWGVVTIDVLQPSANNFFSYIGVSRSATATNQKWLEKMLLSYSNMLSNFVEKRNE